MGSNFWPPRARLSSQFPLWKKGKKCFSHRKKPGDVGRSGSSRKEGTARVLGEGYLTHEEAVLGK